MSQGQCSSENGVEALAELATEVAGIQKAVTETSLSLPPYDVRRTQEV